MDDDCRWCHERRAEVAAYLRREQVPHGRISQKPVWHVIPYVSLWAIETAPLRNLLVGGSSAVTYRRTMSLLSKPQIRAKR